jgi:hypothetical protein
MGMTELQEDLGHVVDDVRSIRRFHNQIAAQLNGE